MSKESTRDVTGHPLVSLRLTVEDALFIANELTSSASVGAEDPAYLRIPDQIQRQLAKHERKQANAAGELQPPPNNQK